MKNASYRKHNDRTHNSSTYHKKDGTPVRHLLKQEAKKEIEQRYETIDELFEDNERMREDNELLRELLRECRPYVEGGGSMCDTRLCDAIEKEVGDE